MGVLSDNDVSLDVAKADGRKASRVPKEKTAPLEDKRSLVATSKCIFKSSGLYLNLGWCPMKMNSNADRG